MLAADSDQLIAWDDNYRFGLAEIDEQHQRLFKLLNNTWSSLKSGAGTPAVLQLIDELEQYAVAHFSAEEEFMRAVGYPRFAYHKKAHDTFVARLLQEKASVLHGHEISEAMLHFLNYWLVTHILVVDRDYAAFSGHYQPDREVLPEL